MTNTSDQEGTTSNNNNNNEEVVARHLSSSSSSSSTTAHSDDRFLECPQCHKVYQDPVMLDCTHSICFSCCNPDSGRIVCPECKSATWITAKEELSPSYLVRRELEATSLPLSKQTCFECEKEAMYWCVDCDETYFCEEHNAQMHAFKLKKGHQVVKAQEKIVKKTQVVKEERKCIHHQERLKVWCQECQHLICSTCALFTTHEGHTVKLYEQAREFADGELMEALKDASHIHLKAMENAVSLEKAIKDMEKTYENLYQEVDKQFEVLLEAVTAKREQVMAQLNDVKVSTITRMQHDHEIFRSKAAKLAQNLSVGRSICKWDNSLEYFEMLGVLLKSLKSHKERVHQKKEVFGLSLSWDTTPPSNLLTSISNIVVTIESHKIIQVSTVAGTGFQGHADGGKNEAKFFYPWGIALDAEENIYIADYSNRKVRKLNRQGIVTTVAGSGQRGDVDGAGGNASFNGPAGIASDLDGTLFVTDFPNNRVRKISKSGAVGTLAGSTAGYVDEFGTEAKFNNPWGISIDQYKNLYVVDYGNHRIRKVTPLGLVTTVAGSGSAGYQDGAGSQAQFNYPRGIALDGEKNMYVADGNNHRIRKVTPQGVVTTLAGNGCAGFADGIGGQAQFNNPSEIAVDQAGNLFVTDQNNNRIRRVTPQGVVSTIAGRSSGGFLDGVVSDAMFSCPRGIALDSEGNIFVGDYSNHRIRKIT